jgi:alginate O-acetyltransferase complex protein AlgI
MVFVSDSFIFFFLPIFLLFYVATPASLRNLTILIFSWVFYAWWRADFLPLLVVIAAWSWLTGLWIARSAKPYDKLVLLLAITGPLSALIWFKYANLFAETARGLGTPIRDWVLIILPIGLSFFVFGAISYSIDVYRRLVKPEPNFVSYATYQSMFGHLVAGPIVRYEWVAERLRYRIFDRAEFSLGVRRFMIGFSQKVLIADTLAPIVDSGFLLSAPTTADVLVAVIAYGMQIYFDFAGYSHMAIGLGLMAGLRFPENFRNPYLSTSLTEFWRRWHISLSSWLRDYLYIPLGGNRGSLTRTYANILITMALGGLWHGASWTFLLWGLWHGIGLVSVRIWRSFGREVSAPVGNLLTIAFVFAGWLLFRAQDWMTVRNMSEGLIGFHGAQFSDAYSAALRPTEFAGMLIAVIAIYWPLMSSIMIKPTERAELLGWSVLPLWLISLWVLQGRAVVPFLYFQF